MDLSKLSDQDLIALNSGDLSKVSDAGIRHLNGQQSTSPPENTEQKQSAWDEIKGGIASAPINLYLGTKQMFGGLSPVEQDVLRQNREAAGKAPVSSFVSNVATLAPTMLIPGANTVAGAGIVGGATGALQPVEGEQSLSNIAKNKAFSSALGAASGVGGQVIGNKAGAYLSSRVSKQEADAAAEALRNAPKDATLSSALEAGYSVPRSLYNPTFISNRLESLGGKAAIKQQASANNQGVTDSLARKALGLAEDTPLTAENMQAIRKSAYQSGYAPLEKLGSVNTDKQYQTALDALVSARKSAANSFPGAVKDEITPTIDALRVGKFDAGEALKMTQILRDEANAAYRAGDNGLGTAKKGAAKAIEDQIERGLSASGQSGADLLKGFRDARTLMAKAHTVEDAIVEGAGIVNPGKLAARVQAGKPMTGELEIAGKFANTFPQVNQVGTRNPAAGVSKSEALAGALLGGGTAMATGNPIGLAAAALPLISHPARSIALSRALQKAPEYSAGSALTALSKLPPETAQLLARAIATYNTGSSGQ